MTATLFDLPDSPAPLKPWQKVQAKFGILTNHVPQDTDRPWLALLPFEEDKGKDFMDIFIESCRIYDESGQMREGNTEEEAVMNLCNQMKLPISIYDLR